MFSYKVSFDTFKTKLVDGLFWKGIFFISTLNKNISKAWWRITNKNILRQMTLVGSSWFLEGYLVAFKQNKNPIHTTLMSSSVLSVNPVI